ncbi:MAG: hypothetical protein AAFQ63_18845 [Cyanobacteria bacterium J06621_11]
MADVRQLELNLEVALEEASDRPESVDVLALWQQFESELSDLPQRDHLRVAGDILMELAGLCETKADLLWEDWQDAHNMDGPVMGSDWLSGLTRQTQELDFSGLVQRSYRTEERLIEAEDIDKSVVGTVEKSSALALADVLDEQMLKTQALSVSHAENVSDWIEQLTAVQTEEPQRLVALQADLNMPLVTIWLAALLGGFCVD